MSWSKSREPRRKSRTQSVCWASHGERSPPTPSLPSCVASSSAPGSALPFVDANSRAITGTASMMRESRPRLAVGSVRAAGRWSARTLQEQVTVFVEAHEVVVRLEGTGEELAADFARITGAGWREGVLSLHLEGEELQLQGGEALDRAWHTLTRRACTLPEVARAMRAFGGAREARAGRDEIGEARQ